MYNKKTQLRKEADRLAWVATIRIRGIDCEICGEPMEDVHHCYRKGMYPHLRYDLDNLSILCRECHDKPDRTILNLLEEKRGKEWRKKLDEKARKDIHKRITISWYKDNIKKLKQIMRD